MASSVLSKAITFIGNLFVPVVTIHTASCARSSSPSSSCTYSCQKQARILVICLWIGATILVALAGVLHKLWPLAQYTNLRDYRFHYPYRTESIPAWLCVVIAAFIPFLTLAFPYVFAPTSSPLPASTVIIPVDSSNQNVNQPLITTSSFQNHHSTTTTRERAATGTQSPSSLRDGDVITHPVIETEDDSAVPTGLPLQPNQIPQALPTPLQGLFSGSLLGCYMAITLSTFITTLFKTIVGRPRPNAWSLSRHFFTQNNQFDKLNALENAYNQIYTTNQTSFTADMSSYFANDAVRSFPSGHSAFAFAGLIYVALVLYSRYLKIIRLAHKTHAPLQVSILSIVNPIFLPIDADRVKSLHCCHIDDGTDVIPSLPSLPILLAPSSTTSTSTITSQSPLVHHRRDTGDDDRSLTNTALMSPRSPSSGVTGSRDPSSSSSIVAPITIAPLPLAIFFYIIVPLVSAGLIAISRLVDFWHHPEDVVCGCLIGLGCALITFQVIN